MPKASWPNQLNRFQKDGLLFQSYDWLRLRSAPLPLGLGGQVTSSPLQFTSLVEDDGGCPQVAPEPIRL